MKEKFQQLTPLVVPSVLVCSIQKGRVDWVVGIGTATGIFGVIVCLLPGEVAVV